MLSIGWLHCYRNPLDLFNSLGSVLRSGEAVVQLPQKRCEARVEHLLGPSSRAAELQIWVQGNSLAISLRLPQTFVTASVARAMPISDQCSTHGMLGTSGAKENDHHHHHYHHHDLLVTQFVSWKCTSDILNLVCNQQQWIRMYGTQKTERKRWAVGRGECHLETELPLRSSISHHGPQKWRNSNNACSGSNRLNGHRRKVESEKAKQARVWKLNLPSKVIFYRQKRTCFECGMKAAKDAAQLHSGKWNANLGVVTQTTLPPERQQEKCLRCIEPCHQCHLGRL